MLNCPFHNKLPAEDSRYSAFLSHRPACQTAILLPSRNILFSGKQFFPQRFLLYSQEYVREYQESGDEEKEDLECLLKKQLQDSSPFAAFKRWLIRDNREAYPDLEYLYRTNLKPLTVWIFAVAISPR